MATELPSSLQKLYKDFIALKLGPKSSAAHVRRITDFPINIIKPKTSESDGKK